MKFFSKLLAVVIIFLCFWVFYPFTETEDYSKFRFVISADGPLAKGQLQDILIVPFENNAEGGLSRVKPDSAFSIQVNAHYLPASSDAKSKLLQLRKTNSDEYTAKLTVAPDSNASRVRITVSPFGKADIILAESYIDIGNSPSLLVVPSEKNLCLGDKATFSLAVFETKSTKGLFKQPIRVKIDSPQDITVVNRVLFTDFNGLATFTTHIHPKSRAGNYKFNFSCKDSQQSFLMTIAQKSEAEKLSVNYKLSKTNSPKNDFRIIKDIQPNPQNTEQAIINFDSKGSSYRHAEIWQNGINLFSSPLEQDFGVIILPYFRNASPQLPIYFRFWMLKDNELLCETRSVIYNKGNDSKIANMIKSAAAVVSPTYHLGFTSVVLTQNGLFEQTLFDKTQSLTDFERPVISNIYDIKKPTSNFGLEACINFSENRFFYVEDELQLSRFRFNAIRVWQDPEKLFKHLIKLNNTHCGNMEGLLNHAYLCAKLSEYLPIHEGAEFTETLEGLIEPLCFLNDQLKSNENLRVKYEKRLTEAVYLLSKLIYVPQELISLIRTKENLNSDNVSVPNFFQKSVSSVELKNSLSKCGKALLTSEFQTYTLSLNDDETIFKTENFSKKKSDIINKIINSRVTPLIVELLF
ncbi:MAG: hypothetical protein PHF29_03180 [Candidatus Riflebacteria bacterium]|nr:hypothetical protein [Candidatus Riflebacteria bacterium]